MDRIELAEAVGKPVVELKERPGKRPRVIVVRKGKKLLSVGEGGVGLRGQFGIDAPLREKFEIVGNALSTAYLIMIDGVQMDQVMMNPGLAKADSCRVIIAKWERASHHPRCRHSRPRGKALITSLAVLPS